jgi:hypothetical protein
MNLGLQSQVVIAYLAALGNKPGALEMADNVEKLLYGQSDWTYVNSAVYKAKTPAERLAWWASGAPLKIKFTETSPGWWGPQISGGVLDAALIDAIRSAYESVFGIVEQTQAAVLAGLNKPAPPVAPPAPASGGGGGLAIVGGIAAIAVVAGVIMASKRKGKR